MSVYIKHSQQFFVAQKRACIHQKLLKTCTTPTLKHSQPQITQRIYFHIISLNGFLHVHAKSWIHEMCIVWNCRAKQKKMRWRRQRGMLRNMYMHAFSAMNRENHTKNLYSLITLLQFIFIYETFTRRINASAPCFHFLYVIVVVGVVAEFNIVSLHALWTTYNTRTHIQTQTYYITTAISCVFSFTWLVSTLASSCQDIVQTERKASAICFHVQPHSVFLFSFL